MTELTTNVSHIRTIDDLYSPAGKLEAVLNSGHVDSKYAALVCHPHPKGGGTMHNKVVYHAMKAFSSLGVPVVRFNFRGVGLSSGEHDDGHGEQEDVRAVLRWMETNLQLPMLFAGFSFGSSVGLRACCGDERVRGRIALGLPVRAEGRDYSYEFLPTCGGPKLFISGDHDQFGPKKMVEEVIAMAADPKQLHWVVGADHFFQGTSTNPGAKLERMQELMRTWLKEEFLNM